MIVSHSLLRDIAVAEETPVDVAASRIILADVVAQLALLIPDMAFYFDTPVRSEIIEEVMVARQSERVGRAIDHDVDASMEQKKREGYF